MRSKVAPLPWKIQIYLKKILAPRMTWQLLLGFRHWRGLRFFFSKGGGVCLYIWDMCRYSDQLSISEYAYCIKLLTVKSWRVCAQNSAPLIRANKTNIYRTIMNILQNWVYLYLDTVHFIWFCYCLSKFNFWTLYMYLRYSKLRTSSLLRFRLSQRGVGRSFPDWAFINALVHILKQEKFFIEHFH